MLPLSRKLTRIEPYYLLCHGVDSKDTSMQLSSHLSVNWFALCLGSYRLRLFHARWDDQRMLVVSWSYLQETRHKRFAC